MPSSRHAMPLGLAAIAALALSAPLPARADTLSDNLLNASSGTEAATGTEWLAAGFTTGTSTETLDSITLLLAQTSTTGMTGAADLGLYSDGGLQPGSLLAALASPAAFSPTLAATTFGGDGLSLTADTTYWAVLSAPVGEYDWSYTADDTGTGTGFTDTWGQSADAGADWFTYDSAPTQMRVTATPSAAVPEPGVPLLLLGAAPLALARLRGRRGDSQTSSH